MQTTEIVQTPLLRERSRKKYSRGTPQLAEEEAPEQEPEEEEYILCRQCSQAITRPAERITVQGSHQHTFANPHGIVFEIGCFKTARGCGYAGPPSFEFTWFSGYAWRVSFCTMCLTH
ncbi:MAG: cereblon family protein, partial [Desulfobacterales bacterium]|nr:cereblon family protein [Desulfobacterales bacterium]